MASVSSLDKDLRHLRLGKYTQQAADEVRTWIEEVLGERLPNGDLLDSIKDGVALCKLANLALPPPGIRFKKSPMPFVQMENISHFLRACQSTTFGLHTHDVFQTVDLYEKKDPAQVLQCIGAFSRAAHAQAPHKFARAIGGKSKASGLTPHTTGGRPSSTSGFSRTRGISNASSTVSSVTSSQPSQQYGGRSSPTRSEISSTNVLTSASPVGNVSSWSRKTDEGATTPAWNIHQYGYMGGASQGNQGISFGARRQITTPAPKVPSLADKERRRREEEAIAENARQEAETIERQRIIQREAEEEQQRLVDEERHLEEARTRRELERQKAEEEKRKWEEEERKWQLEEEARVKEEKELEALIKKEQNDARNGADTRLTGQFLSQYQASQRQLPVPPGGSPTPDRKRIEELERQLQEAKEREAQYERERLQRAERDRGRGQTNGTENQGPPMRTERSKSRQRALPVPPSKPEERPQTAKAEEERQFLQQQWSKHQDPPAYEQMEKPEEPANPPLPNRSYPAPSSQPETQSPVPPSSPPASTPSNPTRPLPNPSTYKPPATTPAPATIPPTSNVPPSLTPQSTPRALPRSPFTRPLPSSSSPSTTSPTKPSSPSPFSPSQTTTTTTTSNNNKPAPPPPSSLLAREMELDRQRQQEWEESQKRTTAAATTTTTTRDEGPGGGAGSGPGQSWDINQYGYLGGDSQNKGGPGLGVGMAGRRQILGPRPPPGASSAASSGVGR